jgi:hypothetical protein
VKKWFLAAGLLVLVVAVTATVLYSRLYSRQLRSNREGILSEEFTCPSPAEEVLAHWGEEGYSRGCVLNGVLDGPWVAWAGGVRILHGQYTAGTPSGTWDVWHRDGNLFRRFDRAHGKDNGPSTEWSEDGRLRARGVFVAGWKTGSWSFWDRSGARTDVVFAQGIPSADLSEVQRRPCPVGTHLVGPEGFGSQDGMDLASFHCALPGDVPHGWGLVWDIRGHRVLELAYENGEIVSRRSITN